MPSNWWPSAKPLPAPAVWPASPTASAFRPPCISPYSEQNRTFQALGVWFPGTANVTGLAAPTGAVYPEEVRTVLVSDGTLQALGVPPTLGRWLGPADQ